ncbi:hypothetical protein AB0J86_10785 [Micromonospora sp. NPDC049559]|uniref:hypothetical protein n=1 Tax=Micromonospora sp. NPDC049559 TaxID=3155923 RepID=UPI00342A332B
MASFDEYAALARQLHELQRHQERSAAETERRQGALTAAADQLGQRLAAQQQRLHQLAQALGEPPPPPVTAPPVPPRPAPPVPGPPGGAAELPAAPAQPELPAGPPRLALPAGPAPGAGATPWAGPVSGGWPAPDGPAHRVGGPGTPPAGSRAAGPAGGAGGPAGPGPAGPLGGGAPVPPPGAPAPRPPSEPASAHPVSPPPPVSAPPSPPLDPAYALELARRAADAADEAALRAESMAQQPPLLPGWSPLARALAVYGAGAFVAIVLEYVLVAGWGLDVVDPFTVFAWTCGGLPAMAFFAAYLVLTVWGKPRILNGKPHHYARLGFILCFAAMPLSYCGFALLPGIG